MHTCFDSKKIIIIINGQKLKTKDNIFFIFIHLLRSTFFAFFSIKKSFKNTAICKADQQTEPCTYCKKRIYRSFISQICLKTSLSIKDSIINLARTHQKKPPKEAKLISFFASSSFTQKVYLLSFFAFLCTNKPYKYVRIIYEFIYIFLAFCSIKSN